MLFETLQAVETWFAKNPSLLILFVPTLSGIVGWVTAYYTSLRVRRSERERIQFERLMKISEFRQLWINSLRDCMSEFQSFGVTPGLNPGRLREFYALGTKIELMMNPGDQDYNALQDCLYEFLKSSEGSTDDKYRSNSEYVAVCQRILKREWDRLKEELNDPSKFVNVAA